MELLVADHGLLTHALLIAYAAVVVDEQRTGDGHHHEKEYPQGNQRRAQPVGPQFGQEQRDQVEHGQQHGGANEQE